MAAEELIDTGEPTESSSSSWWDIAKAGTGNAVNSFLGELGKNAAAQVLPAKTTQQAATPTTAATDGTGSGGASSAPNALPAWLPWAGLGVGVALVAVAIIATRRK